MTETIMLMGTASHVGKSIVTTALCRIFRQEGRRVVPFKAQNMALNSYVTRDGREMGRAQVAQAEAAGLEPDVLMNPVLLKPTGHASSQVIIDGLPVGNMSARDYHKGYSLNAFSTVTRALDTLRRRFDTLVIEGAGSPAEVNLRDHDIVNMRVAKYLQAPVLLIADIDRGGALASLVGTLELLEPDERALVKGLVINKFRGDVSLFTPAIDFLEKKTGKPVLGVLPYLDDLGIDDEDSVSLEEKRRVPDAKGCLRLAVIETPKISNFTDFDALEREPDVALRYVRDPQELDDADMILLPGSKNTIEDLLYLRAEGFETALQRAAERGTVIWGICGGYQMMGERIEDPSAVESTRKTVCGLGFLPARTVFSPAKHLTQVTADCAGIPFLGTTIQAEGLQGYEIHMGETVFTKTVRPFVRVHEPEERDDGIVSGDGKIAGTYLHGLFDHDGFRRQLLNALRRKKGWRPLETRRCVAREKEAAYDRLAASVREHLDMNRLRRIMKGEC